MRIAPTRHPAPMAPPIDDGHERELLRRIAVHERAALEELYGSYQRRLTRFLGRITRRSDLIDEAVNETFWIVWQKAGGFLGESLASTWIMGIAYRVTLKLIRKAGETRSDPPDAEDEAATVEDQVASQELRDWIGHGMRHLPQEQRTTLQLAYYLGHSCEEIAEIMDCPVGTVKARMFHARVKLRNLLPTLGGNPDREVYGPRE